MNAHDQAHLLERIRKLKSDVARAKKASAERELQRQAENERRARREQAKQQARLASVHENLLTRVLKGDAGVDAIDASIQETRLIDRYMGELCDLAMQRRTRMQETTRRMAEQSHQAERGKIRSAEVLSRYESNEAQEREQNGELNDEDFLISYTARRQWSQS
ncbi:MAG: hypothetical protein AB8C46_07870 [Burkholderiaceae bacterium]